MENNPLWHQLRAENVGGSEVADLFNCGFNSHFQLWHIKYGSMDAPDLSEIEWVISGNFLEPGIMEWAKWKWGDDWINPKAYYKHETIRGMACTPDCIGATDSSRMAQIKNIDSMIFGKYWECDGDVITSAPLKYLLQCQQEMACSGCASSDLIVLVGGKVLKKMIVMRDEGIIKIIEDAVSGFWRSIEVGDEPEPDYSVDGPAIQELRKKEVLQYDPIDWSNNNRMIEVANTHINSNEKEKAAKEEKAAATAEIMRAAKCGKKFFMGDHPGAPKITIVDKENSSYPLVTRVK